MKEQKNVNKEQRHNVKRRRGITLIALVVTIVVLLILASVSITVVFGDNGILELAREAAEKTNEAVQNDKEQIEEMGDIINNYLEVPKTVEEAIKRNYKFKENTDIIDKYGNPITIPAGFRIVPNGTDFVEYNYDTNEEGVSTHIPTVQDGIVIEDAEADSNGEKNQFVWIPVCTEEKAEDRNITIKRKIKNKDNTESVIRLARYEFDVGSYQDSTKTYDGTGKATPKQYALNYADIGEETKIEDIARDCCYQELQNSTYGNTTAGEKLKTFVEKTNEKGGYYLARYEAVKGTDGKVKSMASTVDSATSDSQAITKGMVWANIRQPQASTESQAMYEKNANFETDLVNSYAWDTAIVFIQTYSKGNSSYSKQMSKNETVGKTGERDNGTVENTEDDTTDKVCNIYDMSSNLLEWSTETGVDEKYPCSLRGGSCYRSSHYTIVRDHNSPNGPHCHSTFRPLLYVNL